MLKKDVVKFFGNQAKTAEAFGITKVAVHLWPEVIPELRARQLPEITRGKLKFRPELYERRRIA